ncbi:MAG: hypothetical protein IJT79_04555 [Ruminococcus sp.]|nr:hypothetical protein [Ruminococcus sp.]
MKAKIKSYIPDVILYAAPIILVIIIDKLLWSDIGIILLPLYLTIISIWRAAKHKLKNPIIMLVPDFAVLVLTVLYINISIANTFGEWLGSFSLWDTSLPVWVNLLVHFFTYGYMTIFIVAYHIEVKIQNRKKNKEKE